MGGAPRQSGRKTRRNIGDSSSTTISKGIISAYRDHDGLKLIQSDVNIQQGNSGGPLLDQKGNMVGVTVSGIQISGISTGLNFFIPVQDALRFLNIQLKRTK
mgnify:FL=1